MEHVMFKIIYCTNNETLEDRKVDFEKIEELSRQYDGIVFRGDNDFKTWNGGAGNGKLAYLHLVGWGPVETRKDAAKAISWMVVAEVTWPDSESLREAMAVTHEIRKCYE